MIAYVFGVDLYHAGRSGRIYLGQTLPRKAMPLMQGPAKAVREFVANTATRDKLGPVYYLRRMAAAKDAGEAWAALGDYIAHIEVMAPPCIEVNSAILLPGPWSLLSRSAFVRPIKDVLRDCEGAKHGQK